MDGCPTEAAIDRTESIVNPIGTSLGDMCGCRQNEGGIESPMKFIAKKSVAPLVALLTAATFPAAQAASGDETVSQLNTLYNSTRKDCGSPSQPAFLCSGLILEATKPAPGQQFYSLGPAFLARGSASVSYLRKDAKFSRLAGQATSGFVFNPNAVISSGKGQLDVLCAFPVAAVTESRAQKGCGDSSLTPLTTEGSCDSMGVTTGAQWFTHYRRIGGMPGGQCGFDLRKGSAATAQRFTQTLAAIRALGVEALASPNEMVVSPWAMEPPHSPSIMAVFYTDKTGLGQSRLSQVQWYRASGGWRLPIVGMRLPQAVTQEAKFSYAEADQAIYAAGPNTCAKYFESAEWIVRHDGALGKDIPALSIVPSQCGRSIGADQVSNFMNELISRYYTDPQWIGNADNTTTHVEAVRRQLVCHLEIAPGKDRYNLEPSRPLISQAATNAAGCNNG